MQFGLFYQLPCAPEQHEVTRYHETIEQIVYADELGFDIAWLAELHFYRPFSILSSPLILAAALAQRTTRIRLGTAVVLLPLQHPLRVAEDAATVDILSQGRLEVGVGRGAIAIHFQGFNVSSDESRERFEEALTILERVDPGDVHLCREVFSSAGHAGAAQTTAETPPAAAHCRQQSRDSGVRRSARVSGVCGFPHQPVSQAA
jgi:alkanesulfonate monooxygenase SsuD/methylene tetrahydromethanopterin reductase-like flavin-dependent oxidoreductase (luciferase family)